MSEQHANDLESAESDRPDQTEMSAADRCFTKACELWQSGLPPQRALSLGQQSLEIYRELGQEPQARRAALWLCQRWSELAFAASELAVARRVGGYIGRAREPDSIRRLEEVADS